MKRTAIVFVLTGSVLVTLCLRQWRQVSDQKAQLATLQTELDQKAQQVEKLQASQERSQKQRRELADQADELTAQLRAKKAADSPLRPPQPASATESVPAEKNDSEQPGFGKALSRMLQDPDTKKFMLDQQRLMMEQMYRPLIKKLGLSPEESNQFRELLADNAARSTDQAAALFDGGGTTNRAEAARALSAEKQNFEAQLKQLLGEGRYAMYQEYQQTVGERAQLNQFRMQLAESPNPLTDQQTEQLLAVMKEEKQNVAASSGASIRTQEPSSLPAMLSADSLEKALQSQETVNQRVYQRAGQVLAPDQLQTFEKFQTSQLNMMRMSMSMARKMFAPGKSEAGTTP